jgi:hypothetical protein
MVILGISQIFVDLLGSKTAGIMPKVYNKFTDYGLSDVERVFSISYRRSQKMTLDFEGPKLADIFTACSRIFSFRVAFSLIFKINT